MTETYAFQKESTKRTARARLTGINASFKDLGEVCWALMRGAIYSVGFMAVMLLLGLVGLAEIFAPQLVSLIAPGFDAAQKAMQQGDWGNFGKAMDALKRLLAGTGQ